MKADRSAAEFGNAGNDPAGIVKCEILENGSPIASGTTNVIAANKFSSTLTLPAAGTGGTVQLSCSTSSVVQARNRVITAIRVGSLQMS
jgi:hypothetical protein